MIQNHYLGGNTMSIVKFYRGDPNAPKTTMRAHLGANAIITCNDRILLEKRRDKREGSS